MNKENVARPVTGGQDGAASVSTAAPNSSPSGDHPSLHPDVFRFLDFIFEGVPDGRYVEFFYLKSGKKPKPDGPRDFFTLPLNRERIAAEILARDGRQSITVGVAPRFAKSDTGYKGGKNNDVIEVTCIWADIDFRSRPGGAIDVFKRINALPLRPSLVINSGYGRHIYYAFNSIVTGNMLLQWEEMIRSLRTILGSDATTDISRRMRLPGTLNIKEETPVLCHIIEEESSWIRYDLEEVKLAFQKSGNLDNQQIINSASDISTPTVTCAPALSVAAFQAAWTLEKLKKRGVRANVIKAIITGLWKVKTGSNAGKEDDRSSRDFMIASTLTGLNFSETEIAQIFRAYPQGCGSKVADPGHGETYLTHTIKAAITLQASKKIKTAYHKGEYNSVNDGTHERSAMPETGEAEPLPPGYEAHLDGSLWYHPSRNEWDARASRPEQICSAPIRIVEIHENLDTAQISIAIEYSYGDATKRTTILRSQMVEARGLVAALGGSGAPVTSNNARRIVSFLAAYEHHFLPVIPRKYITNRFGRGRNGGAFFLPGLTSDVEFTPTGAGDMALYRAFAARRGTIQEWVGLVNMLRPDTMIIPQVAICAAFVPPLQSKLQIPNFILDINGTTGSGKSISAKLGASVWGRPKEPESIILQWEATKVAIEQIAGLCSELPVFLDDAQHVSDDLKKSVIYMIANGKGKARGAKAGGIRETTNWHTVGISTAEHPLHEASTHEGARARLLPVGGIEVRPFPSGMKAFVDNLERGVAECHGVAGETFIRHLNGWTESHWTSWRQRYMMIRQTLAARASSDIVGRISEYIAAIQLAAEIVRPLFGINFAPEEISRWLMQHLEDQQRAQSHVQLALQVLADFYITNKRNFYDSTSHEAFDKQAQVFGALRRNLFVGFLPSTVHDVFGRRKWNTTAILNKFAAEHVLHNPELNHHTRKVSVDGEKSRMVCIHWKDLFPAGICADAAGRDDNG